MVSNPNHPAASPSLSARHHGPLFHALRDRPRPRPRRNETKMWMLFESVTCLVSRAASVLHLLCGDAPRPRLHICLPCFEMAAASSTGRLGAGEEKMFSASWALSAMVISFPRAATVSRMSQASYSIRFETRRDSLGCPLAGLVQGTGRSSLVNLGMLFWRVRKCRIDNCFCLLFRTRQ